MAQQKDLVTTTGSTSAAASSDLGGLGHRVADLRHRAKDRASRLGHRAQDQSRRAKTGFWRTLEENPLTVGAATFAIGVIAGMALPATEQEDELLGATRDRLLDEVKGAGQQTLAKGRQVADAIAETVKEESEGVVDRVKAAAKEAARARAHADEPELAKR